MNINKALENVRGQMKTQSLTPRFMGGGFH